MSKINFNVKSRAAEIGPQVDKFAPLPAGLYTARIVESQNKQTKAGNGSFLELRFEIVRGIDPGSIGRSVWARLNLENPNPRAVEIAQEELTSLMSAIGLEEIGDSEELHHLDLTIRVVQRVSDFTGKVFNEIKGFSAVQSRGLIAPPAEKKLDMRQWKL